MRCRKILCLAAAILMTLSVATACNARLKYGDTIPEGNPEKLIQQYFDLLAKKDYAAAFDMISIETRKGFTKQQFLDLQDLFEQSGYVLDRAFVTLEESNLEAVDAVRYYMAFRFSVKLYYKDGLTGTTVTESMMYYMVSEEGAYKVHLANAKVTYQNWLVTADLRLGRMYLSGITVAADPEKALGYFKTVLGYTPDSDLANFYAARACLDAGLYDEGMKYANKAVSLVKSDANALTVLADCVKASLYAMQGDSANAAKWFDKAQAVQDGLADQTVDNVAKYKEKYFAQ
jgi:tetratricopeptide (TPR) repeat protein